MRNAYCFNVSLMTEPKSGCLICGKDLEYLDKAEKMSCMYCESDFDAEVKCADGHYVCDDCHSMGGNEIIEKYTIESDSTDPMAMALHLMRHPKVKMHGPEHHFMIPAVLISAYYNHKLTATQPTNNQESETGNLPCDSVKDQLILEKKKLILL